MNEGFDPYDETWDPSTGWSTDITDSLHTSSAQDEMRNNLSGQITGTGLEIGTGIATDAATTPLLALGPWGWIGYGAVNFLSGASSNIAAQRLRGESEISWGEVLSSGAIDIIPFLGVKAKGAKGVANIALQSGAKTVAQQQGAVAIDDQRWLTPTEAGVSFGAGTLLGGTIKAAPEIVGSLSKQVPNPFEIPGFVKGTGTGFGGGGDDIVKSVDWSVYGYKQGTLPTVVNRQTDPKKQALVAESLNSFYNRTNRFLQSKGATNLKGWAQTWQDPVTNKLYSPKLIKDGNNIKRLSLVNVETQIQAARTRHIRDQPSSIIQKQNRSFTDKDKRRMNLTEKAKFNKITTDLTERIKDLNQKIRSLGGTLDYTLTTDRLRQVYINELESLNKQLALITQGSYYGEHGYALRSKVWNHIKKQKRWPGTHLRFKAGDDKNYHLVFQKDVNDMTFKKTKDNFESVIEGLFNPKSNFKDQYPDYVVNYNPNLHGNNQGIIRIERLSTVKVGKEYKNIMSGNVVAEFDFNKMEDRVYSTDEIREWLRNQGIFPVTRLNYKQPPSDFKKRIK